MDTLDIVLIGAVVVLGFAVATGSGALLIYRYLQRPPCPRCGERVHLEQLECPYCEFDFRTLAQPDSREAVPG